MLRRISGYIDRALELVGKTIAMLVFLMIGVIVFEMAARGLFDMPTSWAHEFTSWLLTLFIFLGGPWALAKGQFVRVDVFHAKMSPKKRALVDTFVSTLLFALFVAVLIWLGGKFAISSFHIGERSATGGWAGPVWVPKFAIPLGCILLSFAWISHLIRLWVAVVDGTNKEAENA
ncbi:TRAP transporter small permease subunit [Sneathiella litorea]|uniref:TRAP transporter small permease protein n=1 Tax=Sneathiella litorea TaxID=2606216 RepID=A0A6L8W6M7_9PROT|nr:TRAP transporter small permease subunit [Sneathiella litorea]MZR30040.1 TRAP transporter small permease subunit [Sneathiella litorea]